MMKSDQLHRGEERTRVWWAFMSALSVWLFNTIDRKVLYIMHFGEYTVNIHELLQCSVD